MSSDAPWFTLLRQRVDESSQAAVARDLGFSKATICLVLKGTYAASTKHLAEAVLARYGQIDCPHLKRPITPDECLGYATAPMSTSNPHALDHWAACQACPYLTRKEQK